MHFAIEVRVPFFDQKIVNCKEHACGAFGEGKRAENEMHSRKAMEDRLPDYICWRKSRAKRGLASATSLAACLMPCIGNGKWRGLLCAADFPEWNIRTKEEAFYFSIFQSLDSAAKFNSSRVTANKVASANANQLFR